MKKKENKNLPKWESNMIIQDFKSVFDFDIFNT